MGPLEGTYVAGSRPIYGHGSEAAIALDVEASPVEGRIRISDCNARHIDPGCNEIDSPAQLQGGDRLGWAPVSALACPHRGCSVAVPALQDFFEYCS